ncbi:hypothetical protein Hdeb2414_s0116g00801581 [Helianthus debilis subsp. tardiflorus]
MEEGVPNSFTKLFTFSRHTLDSIVYSVKGFRKTGELIIEISCSNDDDELDESLAVHELNSNSINNIGVSGKGIPRYVYSYKESLLLL